MPVDHLLVVFWREHLERRRKGTRLAIDWRQSLRPAALVGAVLVGALYGGVRLVVAEQRTGGWAVVAVTLVTAVLIARWLLRPVDPRSLALLERRREDERTSWRELVAEVRSTLRRWRRPT